MGTIWLLHGRPNIGNRQLIWAQIHAAESRSPYATGVHISEGNQQFCNNIKGKIQIQQELSDGLIKAQRSAWSQRHGELLYMLLTYQKYLRRILLCFALPPSLSRLTECPWGTHPLVFKTWNPCTQMNAQQTPSLMSTIHFSIKPESRVRFNLPTCRSFAALPLGWATTVCHGVSRYCSHCT